LSPHDMRQHQCVSNSFLAAQRRQLCSHANDKQEEKATSSNSKIEVC
jgi:hypothetical protein